MRKSDILPFLFPCSVLNMMLGKGSSLAFSCFCFFSGVRKDCCF